MSTTTKLGSSQVLKYKITLLKNDGNISKYLSKPKNTNILIQMVKDYYKFMMSELR
jgi:hypothetical protein